MHMLVTKWFCPLLACPTSCIMGHSQVVTQSRIKKSNTEFSLLNSPEKYLDPTHGQFTSSWSSGAPQRDSTQTQPRPQPRGFLRRPIVQNKYILGPELLHDGSRWHLLTICKPFVGGHSCGEEAGEMRRDVCYALPCRGTTWLRFKLRSKIEDRNKS
jgi:hypothetical protein